MPGKSGSSGPAVTRPTSLMRVGKKIVLVPNGGL